MWEIPSAPGGQLTAPAPEPAAPSACQSFSPGFAGPTCAGGVLSGNGFVWFFHLIQGKKKGKVFAVMLGP